MFNDAQKSLLPLAIIPSAIVCVLFYKFGKRGISKDDDTMEKRLAWCYPFIASLVLGEFFFQAVPNSTGNTSFVSAFIMLGFFLVFCLQKYSRVWHDDQFYVSPETSYLEIRNVIDLKNMKLGDCMYIDILDDENVVEGKMTIRDEYAELTRRRFIVYLSFIIMCTMCILEGFFLLHSTWDPWIVTVFFILDKTMESCIISIGGLHAFLHAPNERNQNMYIILASIWCMATACSTLPLITGMERPEALNIVNHIATQIFYALAGGILFWIALYYVCIDQKKTDKREIIVYLAIFGIGAAISWTVGYFY